MIMINKGVCDFCGTCIGVCPVDVISIERHELKIDPDSCIECLVCIHVCPVDALSEDE